MNSRVSDVPCGELFSMALDVSAGFDLWIGPPVAGVEYVPVTDVFCHRLEVCAHDRRR